MHGLIPYKADEGTADPNANTLLLVAVRNGDGTAHLLESLALEESRNYRSNEPPHQVARNRKVRVVSMALDVSADITRWNLFDSTLQNVTVYSEKPAFEVDMLNLEANENITNTDVKTQLHMATHSGKTKASALLLQGNTDTFTKISVDSTLIDVANVGGKEELIDLLLHSSAYEKVSINAYKMPLHLAVVVGQVTIMVQLLKRDGTGDTSLHLALLHRESVTMELLLRHCGVLIMNCTGSASLYVAANLVKMVTVDLLQTITAFFLNHLTDRGDRTPLHMVTHIGRELLHDHADIMIRNFDWNTLTATRVFHLEGDQVSMSLLQKDEKLSATLALLNNYRLQSTSNIYQNYNATEISDNDLRTNVPFKFSKRTGTSGVCGQLYETKLLSLVLIRALNDEQIDDFLLGTKVRGTGDLHDICLRYRVKDQDKPVVLFVQAKHRQNSKKRRLTIDALRRASGDFSLWKYLKSYYTIKDRFRANNEDPMFEGDFSNVESSFVIYTPVKDCFTRKTTDRKVSKKVHYLLNTGYDDAIFQYDYDENDTENLTKKTVIEQLKKMGAIFLQMIMSDKNKTDNILLNKLIMRYHVVMGREVLQPSKIQKADEGYRIWEFKPEFFESNCEYLNVLKRTFAKELLTKRCDKTKITNEDRDNFKLFLQDPCAATISKLIGKLATYSEKNKKLQLIEVTAFKNKFEKNKFKDLLDQFNEIKTNENAISEAVKIKLSSVKIKLPLSFGNLDMTFYGSKVKVYRRIKAVAEKLIHLLEVNKDMMIVHINEDVVGPGKTIEQGIIDVNGGIGSAVGNLLVLDPDTNMLKFVLDNKALPVNAALFLNELRDTWDTSFNEKLSSYRIKINIDGFPKYVFNGDEYDSLLVNNFLSNLWFFTNQAKQDVVECTVKNDIQKYYNYGKVVSETNYEIHPGEIFCNVHDEVQKWWKQTSEANYLSRNSAFFQNAILDYINNLSNLAAIKPEPKMQKCVGSYVNCCNSRLHQAAENKHIATSFDKIFDEKNERINTRKKIKELEHAIRIVNVAESNNPSTSVNILEHKEEQRDNIIINKQKNINTKFKVNEFKYSKIICNSGVTGQLYETKMLCLVLIRALSDEQIKDFFLGSNIRGIGDMDDICFRYRLKGQDRPVVLFVQAKHRENCHSRGLTVQDVQTAYGSFSLQKYFESYLTIKAQFRANNEDPMFTGDFGDVQCNFVIYTSAKNCFTKKNTDHQISDKVHYLINTGQDSDVFQYDYDDNDLENLTKMTVIERLKKLGVVFLEIIMSEKDKSEKILLDKLILRYHVVLGREVLQPNKMQKTSKEYRMWKFNPEFFDSNCEYLSVLKKTFAKELSTKRYDQSKITNVDLDNFKLVLQDPCAATISKLIGKLAIYNEVTKKLQLIEVTTFKNKFKTEEFKTLVKQFNEIKTDENVISEAIKIKLASVHIKLPLSFGNLDMTFRGSEVKVHRRIRALAKKLIHLFEENKDTKIVDISEEAVGPGKTVEQGTIDGNGGIGGAVGNLLVLDPDTKMLKLNLDNKALPDNAALFLKELKDATHKPVNEELCNYRIKINVDEFPKYDLNGDEYLISQARDFLAKFWFYVNQAKEDKVEDLVKDKIKKCYSKISVNRNTNSGISSELVYSTFHDNVRKWWMETSKSSYLTRASGLIQLAKEGGIANLLQTVINYIPS